MKVSPTRSVGSITLAGIFGALTLALLFAASLLPTLKITLYVICSFFPAVLTAQRRFFAAGLLFAGVLGLGFLLLPNKTAMVPFAALFGWYPIAKYFLETLPKIWSYVAKLAAFNAGLYVLWLIIFWFLPSIAHLPVWLLAGLAQIAFLLYDWILSQGVFYYGEHIHRHIAKFLRG